MEHPLRQMRAWRWEGPSLPLTIGAYVAWIAMALEPLRDALNGRILWSAWTVAGIVGLLAVPLLFTTANFRKPNCPRTPLMHALMVLQLSAALLAFCGLNYALNYIELAALLVIVGAQL